MNAIKSVLFICGIALIALNGSALQSAQHLADLPVQSIFVDPICILAGTEGGDGIYLRGDSSFDGFGDGLDPRDVLAIVRSTTDGALYAGTWGGGVYRRAQGQELWARNESMAEGYTYIRAMAQDPRNGTLYAIDPRRYVYRLLPSAQDWQVLDPAGLPDNALRSVYADHDGQLYLGLADAGVYALSAEGWQRVGDLGHRTVYAMDTGPDGLLWVGTNAGVLSWDGNSWHLISDVAWQVTALLSNPAFGEPVIGTASGTVYRYQNNSREWFRVETGIPTGTWVWALGFGPFEPGLPQELLIGTDVGLYITSIDHRSPEEAMTIGMWHSLVPGTEELAYTISYGNRYPEVVGSVVITNMVPLTVTLVSDSYGNGNCGDATWDVVGGRTKLTWVCGEVAPGDGGSVGYRVQLPAGMLTQEPDLAARRPPDPQETPTPPPAIVNDGAHIGWTLGKETYYQKTARDVFPPDPVLLPVVKVMY